MILAIRIYKKTGNLPFILLLYYYYILKERSITERLSQSQEEQFFLLLRLKDSYSLRIEIFAIQSQVQDRYLKMKSIVRGEIASRDDPQIVEPWIKNFWKAIFQWRRESDLPGKVDGFHRLQICQSPRLVRTFYSSKRLPVSATC